MTHPFFFGAAIVDGVVEALALPSQNTARGAIWGARSPSLYSIAHV